MDTMSTKKAVSPRNQKGLRERKRPFNFTPPSSNKKQKDRNEELDTEDICRVCEDPIIEYSATSEGEETVFCEGQCNTWIYRKCSGLTSTLFDIISFKSEEPFCCWHCLLMQQTIEINTLKALLLTERISILEPNTIKTSTIPETPSLVEPLTASLEAKTSIISEPPSLVESFNSRISSLEANAVKTSSIPETPRSKETNYQCLSKHSQ